MIKSNKDLTFKSVLRNIPLSMLKIRLQRIGRRNQPYYRLVVTDSRFGPKSGRFIEVIGSYDPKAGNVDVKKDRAQYWIEQGAQSSDTAYNFLVDNNVVEGKKRNALPKKTPIKKEEEEVAEESAQEETKEEAATEEAAPAEESQEESATKEAAPEEAKEEEVKEEAPADASAEASDKEEEPKEEA